MADDAARHAQDHGRAGSSPVAGFPLELLVGVAGAGSEGRDQDGGEDFVFSQRGHVGAVEKVYRLDLARALGALQLKGGIQGHGNCGVVVARVAMGDVAANGAAVANLRVSDQQRRFDQQGQVFLQQGGGNQLVLRGHRANADDAAAFADAAQFGNAVDINQHAGLGKAQLHHGQQAVAASEQLGVVAMR